MDLDQYYADLELLAADRIQSGLSSEEFLESLISSDKASFDKLLQFRKSFVGLTELENVRASLSIGFFKEYEALDRTTCFVICFELTEIVTKKNWRQRCELYNISQPLFINATGMFDYVLNDGLIDGSVLEQINDSEILKCPKGYTYLEYEINPVVGLKTTLLLNWIRMEKVSEL